MDSLVTKINQMQNNQLLEEVRYSQMHKNQILHQTVDYLEDSSHKILKVHYFQINQKIKIFSRRRHKAKLKVVNK